MILICHNSVYWTSRGLNTRNICGETLLNKGIVVDWIIRFNRPITKLHIVEGGNTCPAKRKYTFCRTWISQLANKTCKLVENIPMKELPPIAIADPPIPSWDCAAEVPEEMKVTGSPMAGHVWNVRLPLPDV